MFWYLIVMMHGGYGASTSVTPMPSKRACAFVAAQVASVKTPLNSKTIKCVGSVR